jgi:hypothetical protein
MNNEEVEKKIHDYVESIRPKDAEIRKQMDIGYTFIKNVLLIHEIRPDWQNPENIMHHDFFKAKYVKSVDLWKLYWLRANLKWDKYQPCPEVATIEEVLETLDDDEYSCFRG